MYLLTASISQPSLLLLLCVKLVTSQVQCWGNASDKVALSSNSFPKARLKGYQFSQGLLQSTRWAERGSVLCQKPYFQWLNSKCPYYRSVFLRKGPLSCELIDFTRLF